MLFPLTDEHKGYAKRSTKFQGWHHPFSSALKIAKRSKICENKIKKERTRVVCSRDVKDKHGKLGGRKRIEEDDNSEEVIQFQSRRIAEKADA